MTIKFLNRFALSTIVIFLAASLTSNSLIMANWGDATRWVAAGAWFLAFVISSLATFGENAQKGK